MLWELDEFQGPEFLGFVRAIPEPNEFIGSRWLPNLTINDLAFEYILGTSRRPVMATILGWDSEAPLHGRRPLGEKVSGELPPIKRKVRFGEKELIRFLTPRANTSDEQDAIDSVYNLTAEVIEAVFARVEWLRMQALTEDKIVYSEDGVIFEFDYGIDDTHQIDLVTQQDGAGTSIASDVSTVWTDLNNSNPIFDLGYACDKIQGEGKPRPVEFVCSRKTVGLMLNNTAIRQLIRGSSAPAAILTREELNTAFQLYELPPIVTYDVTVQAEGASGTLTDVRPMAQNKGFLVPGGGPVLPGHSALGATLWGPTAESRELIGTPLSTQAPGVYAKTYGKEDPPEEYVKAAGVTFPSMPGADSLVQFKLYS